MLSHCRVRAPRFIASYGTSYGDDMIVNELANIVYIDPYNTPNMAEIAVKDAFENSK